MENNIIRTLPHSILKNNIPNKLKDIDVNTQQRSFYNFEREGDS